jgi:haloacetate dehalogenase
MEFAKAYYHWFLLIQPAPFPETLMSADPEFFLKSFMSRRSGGLGHFAPEAFAEYLRCFRLPDTPHGICEDYRASATIDLEHERIDLAAGTKIQCEMLALWGAEGAVQKCFRPLDEWKRLARNVHGHALPCGHYIPEETPELLLSELLEFL